MVLQYLGNAFVPVTIICEHYTPNNNFQSCLANLCSQAIAAEGGVSGSTYDRLRWKFNTDYSVIDKLNYATRVSTPRFGIICLVRR